MQFHVTAYDVDLHSLRESGLSFCSQSNITRQVQILSRQRSNTVSGILRRAIRCCAIRTRIDQCVNKNKYKKRAKQIAMLRQNLQECLLQKRAQSGACIAPVSIYGTLHTASQVQPQLSWTSSDGLSRQLEPDFSHAGHTAAMSGANREGAGARHTYGQHHAYSDTNGNGTSSAHGHARVKDAQHQQPSMQAGECELLSYKHTCPQRPILSYTFDSYSRLNVPSKNKQFVTCHTRQDNLFQIDDDSSLQVLMLHMPRVCTFHKNNISMQPHWRMLRLPSCSKFI